MGSGGGGPGVGLNYLMGRGFRAGPGGIRAQNLTCLKYSIRP